MLFPDSITYRPYDVNSLRLSLDEIGRSHLDCSVFTVDGDVIGIFREKWGDHGGFPFSFLQYIDWVEQIT